MVNKTHYCTKCHEKFKDIDDLDDHLIEEHNAPRTLVCWFCCCDGYKNWFHLQQAFEEHLESEKHKEAWKMKCEYHRQHSLNTTRAEIPTLTSWVLGRHSDLVCDKMAELFVGPRRVDSYNQAEVTEEEYDIIHRLSQEESEQKRYSRQLRRYRDEAAASPLDRRVDAKTQRELDAAIGIDRQIGQVRVHPERRTIIQRSWHAEAHLKPSSYGGDRVAQIKRDDSVGCYEKLVQQQRKLESDRLQATYNMLSPSKNGKLPNTLRSPTRKLEHHIKLQSDLSQLGYTNRIKARLNLPKDYNPHAFTILTLDFSSTVLTPRSRAVPTTDVVTIFGFADDLVLNRHSQDFYTSEEAHEDEDHDEFTLGKTGVPRQTGKGRKLRTPIYPPNTGKRERYGGHSVQSETMIGYLAEHPQAVREPGDLEGLPNPVTPRNKKGVFVRDDFLRKQMGVVKEGEGEGEDEDGMDID